MKHFQHLFKNTIVLLFFLSTISFSIAQDFEVAPVSLNFSLEPREIGTKTVKITNYSNKRETFTMTVGDMDFKNGQEISNLPPGTTKNSLANWLNVFPTIFELNPNESATVEVTLTVPPDEFDTKWALIYVQSTKERTSTAADMQMAAGLMVTPRIRIVVMNSPKSNTNFQAKISNLKQREPKEGETFKVYSVDVLNNGGKQINAKVSLIAANLETGKEYKQAPISFPLLPMQSRNIELPLSMNLKKGKYALAAVLDYGKNTKLEVVQKVIEIE